MLGFLVLLVPPALITSMLIMERIEAPLRRPGEETFDDEDEDD